ncbi:hypothetical protein P8452_65418 [Trifolium repens]|nr:F-box protein [Trifolium repens]KAK2453261.1 F-box protein [Trifolium repens]WJX24200.1 hypothetical protein P8452_13335 [Trifolium repens]WJX77296.1 hypothetical protein P8452_60617 [Trifolium repens]WJX82694.1 hypothetical protein P8452_65418 [Trifolium repens]
MCEVSRITQEPWQLHWWKFARGPNFEGLHASQRNEILMLSLCEGHVYSPLICLRYICKSRLEKLDCILNWIVYDRAEKDCNHCFILFDERK